jgi:CHAT domain-containing protein
LVWFFGHGRTRFDGEIKASYFAPSGSDDATLVFNQWRTAAVTEKEINASIIMDLMNNGRAPAFLEQGPLVVLIACETGTAAAGGTSGLQITESFLKLGARGVIATEAEIDGSSASLFGETLLSRIAKLNKDEGASLALLRTRLEMFQGYGGNLWPLLFYYAGTPGPYAEL